jgi:hypothetical protein
MSGQVIQGSRGCDVPNETEITGVSFFEMRNVYFHLLLQNHLQRNEKFRTRIRVKIVYFNNRHNLFPVLNYVLNYFVFNISRFSGDSWTAAGNEPSVIRAIHRNRRAVVSFAGERPIVAFCCFCSCLAWLGRKYICCSARNSKSWKNLKLERKAYRTLLCSGKRRQCFWKTNSYFKQRHL